MYGMMTLTRQQQKILDFLAQCQNREHSIPTVREIAAHFKFKSPGTVTSHLRLLRQKGAITSDPGKARGLRLSMTLTPLLPSSA
jgi:SOS-response transcriptional repressor LexA